MNLTDIGSNKKRTKKREFNDFGKVTELVRAYKLSNSDDDLLGIIKALEGIINTYTLIISPGEINQQIHITPYMKKFLGMFFTPEERADGSTNAYQQTIARVRWIMRQYSYEDIYSYLLQVLIQSIKSMKVIGTCDCIYYIQLIVKYKLHDLIIKNAKDASTNLAEMPVNQLDENESQEDSLDRMVFTSEDLKYENKLLTDRFYDDITINVLINYGDIWKCFCPYEKYLLYLKDGLELTHKQMKSILRYETIISIKEKLEDIYFKLNLINEEET